MSEVIVTKSAPAPRPAKFAAKQYFIKWGLISLSVLVLLVSAESLLVDFGGQAASSGRSFASYREFITFQETLGYLSLGRFRDQWPAEISEERLAMNGLTFVLTDGTRHTYPEFDGYELKLVRLITPSGEEGVIVLRSRNKKAL